MRKESREILIVAALHIALALIVSLPLVGHFNSGIPYSHRVDPGWETVHMQQGDHLQFFYTLTLFGDYVRNGTRPFFAEPYNFRTEGAEKYFAPRELPLSIVHFIMSPLGNIIAFNLLTVLSFLACGLGMFLLAGRYVKNFEGKLFASVVFSIFPFRMAQLFGGHPNGFILFLIPFMVYGYERWFDEGKFKHLLLASACLLSMTMEELHLGYFSALFTAAFIPYKGLSMLIKSGAEERAAAVKKFVSCTAGIAIAWLLAGGYVAYLRSAVFRIAEVSGGRDLAEIGIYAPRFSDFFLRSGMDAEKLVYPGIGAVAAAGFAFIRKRGENFSLRHKFTPLFFLFIVFVTALLSLGPNFPGIPLYNFFYNHVPFFHYPRSTARIFVFTMMALAILGAYGVERLRQIARPRLFARLLVPALIVLSLFDYQSFRSIGVSTLSRGNSVYEHVKRQEDPGFLLEVPLWPGDSSWSSVYLYYNTLYRLPMVNGYSPFVAGEYIEGVFWPLASVNMGVINRSQHARLQDIGVNYIILHEEAYPARVSPFPFRLAAANMKANPFVEFVKRDGSLYLFRVRAESDYPADAVFSVPSVQGVFHEAEHLYSRTGGVVEDPEASGGLARFADSSIDGEDFLLFGPYRLFPPGEYSVIFRLAGEADDPDGLFARLEIAGGEGSKIIAARDLKGGDLKGGGYADYALPFSIEELEVIEFRIKWTGNGGIRADYVYMTFAGEEDPVYRYEASELFNSRGDRAYGLRGVHPPHNIAWGGMRRYDEGAYTASFRVKAGELPDEEIAILRVLHAGTGEAVAEKRLRGADFPRAGEFLDADIPFRLDKQEVLSFEIFFTGKADLAAESITITPAGDAGK